MPILSTLLTFNLTLLSMKEEQPEEGGQHPTEDAGPDYDVHPDGQFVGFADILVACPTSSTVVRETLLVGVTLGASLLPLDANFLDGVAVESDSAVVTGDDVNIFIMGTIRDVSSVFDHARQAECNIGPRALEI